MSARGYRLQLRGVDPATAYEVAKEVIYRQSADALAIHVSVIAYPLSGLLTKSHFPHIVLGAPNFESQVCWIDNNNVYSGTVAAAYLLSRGYRKIAFIGGQYYDFGSLHRLQGVKAGTRKCRPAIGRSVYLVGRIHPRRQLPYDDEAPGS